MKSNHSYWRTKSVAIVAEVIKANPDADEKTMRKLISEKYPFGERAMWPYKIWLSEVAEQLRRRYHQPQKHDAAQMELPVTSTAPTGGGEGA